MKGRVLALPDHLLQGYHAFRTRRLDDEQARFRKMGWSGQRPLTALIGCCDSRVPPEVVFDADPGELFVVRNVANLVPPYEPDGGQHSTSAALEFAVQELKVANIVILGHARCGGVRAFLSARRAPLSPGDFVGKWVSILGPAHDDIAGVLSGNEDEDCSLLEVASLRRGLANLRTFPCISILEEKGRLALHAVYFSIATGRLLVLDEATNTMLPIDGERIVLPPMSCVEVQ
ncbi:carbonic anhydrase [Candidatus Raskinella chloraquaticus]|uniref:carbonic anhydrase n=2 Tax=Candidatus Raskinella chloraquaticus TaxID=1951219 RepID=UPI00366A786F